MIYTFWGKTIALRPALITHGLNLHPRHKSAFNIFENMPQLCTLHLTA